MQIHGLKLGNIRDILWEVYGDKSMDSIHSFIIKNVNVQDELIRVTWLSQRENVEYETVMEDYAIRTDRRKQDGDTIRTYRRMLLKMLGSYYAENYLIWHTTRQI